MPDPIEAAFQKVVENAEANCPFDTLRPWVIEDVGANRIVNTMNDCTCHATIDAAAEGMLAAVEGCHDVECRSLFREPPHPLSMCSACRAKATINRLREEAKK